MFKKFRKLRLIVTATAMMLPSSWGSLASAAPAVNVGILSFSTSSDFVQKPAVATLSWQVNEPVNSLEIQPDVGDVTGLTSNGLGSVAVSPLGKKQYRLILNGNIEQSVEVIGLPEKEKVHLYLMIGQSNMQGSGRDFDASLDAPDPRILQFGSRDGMESDWLLAEHPLTSLGNTTNAIGMGLEFGKAVLTDRNDPEIVIGIINHALGATAIQWWAPGAPHSTRNRPGTSDPYFLYDEAVQRVNAAKSYGVVKGVLWHQGEYNSNPNQSNPPPEWDLYAGRLQTLVDNLRADLEIPWLPFVCGEMVPSSWVNEQGQTIDYARPAERDIIEAALNDLPNHRSNTRSVQNTGLRGHDDEKIHFDADSQRELGRRYAAEIQAMYADPFLLYLGGFHTPAEMQDPDIIDPQGDNDNDGLSNFQESLFILDPAAPDATPPFSLKFTSTPEGSFAQFSFRKRRETEAPDSTVKASQDLIHWFGLDDTESPLIQQISQTDNGDGTWQKTVRAIQNTVTAARLFFRIETAP